MSVLKIVALRSEWLTALLQTGNEKDLIPCYEDPAPIEQPGFNLGLKFGQEVQAH